MLSFVTFKDAPEQIEIVANQIGFEELIEYLEAVKNSKDHMHLVIDSELNEISIFGKRKGKTLNAKHVRIEFANSKDWEVNNLKDK